MALVGNALQFCLFIYKNRLSRPVFTFDQDVFAIMGLMEEVGF